MRTIAIFLSALIPLTATANPCTTEHVAEAGKPAACTGVLSPPATALAGATCIDYALPTCKAHRKRDAKAHARTVVMMARDATECDARADRWKALALAPAPALPPKVIVRTQGFPGWMVGAVTVAAAFVGGYVGFKLAP